MPADGDDGAGCERTSCDCKVGDAIDAYGLGGVNADLRRDWTGSPDERYSVRELTERFNRAVLRSAMEDAGMSVLEGEVSNLYRLLTDEDTSEDTRTRARRRLEREGVDVAGALDAAVSHQTMYRHLRSCLDAEASDGATEGSRERTQGHLRSLQQRVVAVTESALSALRSKGELALADFDVLVDVSIICGECGRDYEVGTLLSRGGCECQQNE